MKLSERERQIIAATCFGRGTSISQISQWTGIREHSLRYSIDALLERRIISPYTLINSCALGYTEYQIFISLLSRADNARKRLISELQNSEQVSWLSAVGGEYHLDCLLLVKYAHEVSTFFETLSQRLGNVDFFKSAAASINLTHFPPKFLGKYRFPRETITYGPVEHPVDLDEIDHRILMQLMRSSDDSTDYLARKLKMPASTVRYRLRALQDRGIIIGFGYYFHARTLGMATINLLIEMKRTHASSRRRLFDYCRKHPNIVLFTDQLGAWDYQLCATMENSEEVPAFIDNFLEEFESEVRNVYPLHVYNTLKHCQYPFVTRF